MPANAWENLIGAVVEGRYRLRTLTYSSRDHAEYLAETAELQARGEKLTVTLISAAQDDIDLVRSQLRIASRLDHPNLVHIVGAGETAVEGQLMLYLASETPDQTLADVLAAGPLPQEAVRGLALHVLGALRFLHEQGLAYRALDPQTTVRVDGRWKLADYGQVCPIGERSAEPPGYESPYLPPEANTGGVAAAWDIWSLGVLLREALSGQVTKVRKLPPPFEDVVQGCLEAQPERRLTPEAIQRMLDADAPGAAGAAEEGPAEVERLVARPAAGQPAAGRTAEKTPPAVPRALPVTAQPHYPRLPSSGNVWRTLRVLALIALACLAVLVPLSWWRKSAPHTPQAAPAAAEAPSATRRTTPAQTASPAAAARGAKAIVAKANYISAKMQGHRTATGERFDNNALTATTRAFHLGSRVRVTNLSNSKSVEVRVNDRGGRSGGIGLTERAAREIGITHSGTAQVLLEALP
jgi:rare lipoprotein A